MAVEQVFLHVGCPKTGTTFLQSAFWNSRDALVQQGVHMPLGELAHVNLALAVRELHDPTMDSQRARNVMQRMSHALSRSTTPTVLIDSEKLAGATGEQAARLHRMLADSLGDAEVHVVITARDLARQVPSEWQQQIKHRRTITWADFGQSLLTGTSSAAYFLPAQDAADVARRWRGAVPAHRVHVVTVPRPGTSHDVLLGRFCSVVGVDPASIEVDAARRNDSLGLTQVELLRRVNVALGDRLPHTRAGYGRGKRYLVREVLARVSGGDRPAMSGELVAWCAEHTDRLIGEIRIAGYDVVGDLDELRSDPRAAAPPTAVHDSAIAEMAVTALAQLLDQHLTDLREIDALRAKLAAVEGRT